MKEEEKINEEKNGEEKNSKENLINEDNANKEEKKETNKEENKIFFTIVIPVYNRPLEIKELLASCVEQTYKNFEVLVIEDGSTLKCNEYVDQVKNQLSIQYFEIENMGQGMARNYGFKQAKGDYWITLDSDVLLPANYLENVNTFLQENKVDAFGGGEREHASFTDFQRAIHQSMNSFLTTGGTRKGVNNLGIYYPRSYNMGITPKVFEETGGYKYPYKGEDLDFSIRIVKAGFKTAYFDNAYVYHKRRLNTAHFFRQMRFFGAARVFLQKIHPIEAGGWKYMIPSIITVFILVEYLFFIFTPQLVIFGANLIYLYFLIIFIEALIKTSNFVVAFLTFWASVVLIFGYGIGYLEEKFFKGTSIQHHSPER